MELENNIPEGWVETTLGDLIEVKHGFAFKGEFITELPCNEILVTPGNFKVGGGFKSAKFKYYSGDIPVDYVLKSNDIIVTMTDLSKEGDTLGYSARVPTDKKTYLHNQRIGLVLFKNEKFDKEFAYWFLRTRHYQKSMVNSSTGSTVSHTSPNRIKEYTFNLPPLPEQKAIAKVLTVFDDKIELLQAQNKTLETMAQTIFKEWFGKYQIGDELPEGWRVAKVNEFVKSSIGGDYGKETIEGDYTEETICLRGTDLPDMKMGTPKKAPIRFLKASKLERCKLENGDIVVEISGGTENQSTGRAMYINEKILSSANHPMTCVNFCRIIRPLKLEYSYFLHSLFDYLYTRKVFFNWENGTTGIKNLNLKALLEDFDLFVPENGDLILDFNKNVKAVFNKIQTNNSQVQSLTKTRDTLLPKLMSGQVRVNNSKNT
jgi:type I restriction enzyme, S subunit